jgi:hypothetical protein
VRARSETAAEVAEAPLPPEDFGAVYDEHFHHIYRYIAGRPGRDRVPRPGRRRRAADRGRPCGLEAGGIPEALAGPVQWRPHLALGHAQCLGRAAIDTGDEAIRRGDGQAVRQEAAGSLPARPSDHRAAGARRA